MEEFKGEKYMGNGTMSRCSGDDCWYCQILKEVEETEENAGRDWFFTFGYNHIHDGRRMDRCYVVFHGTHRSAREKMVEHFGDKWAFQYHSAERAGVERWGLTEVHVGEKADVTK